MPDTAICPPHVPHAAPLILAADSPQAGSARKVVPFRLGAQQARLARAVRRGCFVRLPGASLVFALRPADGAGAKWSGALLLDTPDGPIEIAGGARLIQGLTGIHPGFLKSLNEERRQWFDAVLAARLADTPLAEARIAGPGSGVGMEDSCCMQLSLRSPRHMLTMPARAPVSAWLGLLSRGGWSCERSPVSDLLRAEVQETVRAAQHTLPSGVLRTLMPGDVIVPDSPLFRPDGQGRMHLGKLRMAVRYVAPDSLEILDVEGKVNTENQEHDVATAASQDDADAAAETTYGASIDGESEPRDHQAQNEAQALFAELDAAAPDEFVASGSMDADGPLDSVPVALSFELGKVTLSLADVRTLGPGAVVVFTGGSPDLVAITSAGQTLGQGEIVDVDGCLGIRVTRWRTLC